MVRYPISMERGHNCVLWSIYLWSSLSIHSNVVFFLFNQCALASIYRIIHPPPLYFFYSSIKLFILSCIHPSIHFIFIFLSDDQSIPDCVKVVPLEWLQYFDERELELIICGMQNIDTEVRTSLSFRLGPSVCLRTGARICFHQLLDVFAYLKPTTCSLILPVPTFLKSSFSLWSVTAYGCFRIFLTFIAFSYMLPLTEILVPLCHIYVHNCTHCTMHYCVANRLISLRICELIMLIVGLHCLPAYSYQAPTQTPYN